MNSDTNRIFWGHQQVEAARARGERLLPLQQISDAKAQTKPQPSYTDGLNRRERRRQAKLARQRAKQR